MISRVELNKSIDATHDHCNLRSFVERDNAKSIEPGNDQVDDINREKQIDINTISNVAT